MAITPTSLTVGGVTSYAELTKGADSDTSANIAHGLGAIPEYANLTPVSGTEAAWKITGMDATNVAISASNTAGTAASKARLVAGIRHSFTK